MAVSERLGEALERVHALQAENDVLHRRCEDMQENSLHFERKLAEERARSEKLSVQVDRWEERWEKRCEERDARCERLETALKDSAKTFREYEEMHRAKGTQEGRAKAFANGVMADRCEKALAGEQPEGKP